MDLEFGKFPNSTRSRCWMLLLYPDDPILNKCLVELLPSSGFDYVGIKHDKEGKEHFHVVLCFHNPRNANGLTDVLEIEARWVRPWDRKNKAFRYLCHKDNPEKFQYDIDALFGSLTDDAIKACKKDSAESETGDVKEILSLLNSIDHYVSFGEFISLVAERNLWSSFRRMGAMGTRLVDEHNNAISHKRHEDEVKRDAQRFNAYVSSGQSRNIDFQTWCKVHDKSGIKYPDLD